MIPPIPGRGMGEKRICVTGAAGFIGYHAALALKQRGDQVFGFDNFDPYYSPPLKRARMQALCRAGVELATGDLTDLPFLTEYFAKRNPTHVLHLAAQAGVRYSLENPQAFSKSNLLGFCQILEVCRSRPEMPLIFASSSSVYGETAGNALSESAPTDRPISLYGATKKCNEVLASTYHHLFGIKATALRFFTVYGPWGRPDMAYWIFTRALLRQEPLYLNNLGEMRRDFTYIDDLVSGIVAALDHAAPLAIYNLGNRAPHSLEEFLTILEVKTGCKAERHLRDLPQGDVRSTCADVTLAERELGYAPKVSLQEGLSRFVDWYRGFHNE